MQGLLYTYIHLVILCLTYIKYEIAYTLTGWCIPRPPSCILTSASTVSHQVVACVTTVGGYLSKCCSSSVINLATGWISQIATVHNCQNEEYIVIFLHLLEVIMVITLLCVLCWEKKKSSIHSALLTSSVYSPLLARTLSGSSLHCHTLQYAFVSIQYTRPKYILLCLLCICTYDNYEIDK